MSTRKPTYQLVAEELWPGDVIIEAGTGFLSAAISFFDWGAYSHASLYVGLSLIIEADGGVKMVQASRVSIENPEHYVVLRHPDLNSAKLTRNWLQNDEKRLRSF